MHRLNFLSILRYLRTLHIVWGISPGSKLCTTFLDLAKNDEIISKNQFTGTATQPQCNRNFFQFNKDQYCKLIEKNYSDWNRANRFQIFDNIRYTWFGDYTQVTF